MTTSARTLSTPACRAQVNIQRRLTTMLAGLLVLGALSACASGGNDSSQTFRILTGTENRVLFDNPGSDEPALLEQFAQDENITFVPTFQGSVDTMLDLQQGATEYDAVWPASSIWLDLGDTQDVVSRQQSIMGTPIVFGVKRSKAEQLGWIGTDVSVDDILAAAESGQLDYMMSSASQSNSGAMAYLGYLYAFAGHPDVLTSTMLHDPDVADKTSRLLGLVDRTAGASGYLRDLFLENYGDYDGMVNNESAIISANQTLTERGETDLLHVIYPVDGLAIADWPLGFVDHGDSETSEIFDELQAYLLSEEAQDALVALGRRTTDMGLTMDPADVDPEVFNPDWGIDVTRPLDPITLPAADVILEALELYQTSFRKPSFVVFCLDFSGSMAGDGAEELKAAMQVLLDQQEASKYFLQRTARDTTIVLPFADDVKWEERVEGNDPATLQRLLAQIEETGAEGGTNLYDCLSEAQFTLSSAPVESAPAIVLMTDGKSNAGSFSDFAELLPEASSEIVPVYSIQFGDASSEELERIADATYGAIYDGRDGLIQAMRDAFANA